MAIVFPREFPSLDQISICAAKLLSNVAISPSNGGQLLNISAINKPVWTLNVETGLLTPDQLAEWSAWGKSLRGGQRFFLAPDTRYMRPRAMPASFATETANVTALGNSTIGLDGLIGYTASAGDRIGLEQNGHYGYYEVMETVAADGLGAITVTVEPFIQLGWFDANATARIIAARTQYVIDWASWQEPEKLTEPDFISFSGTQRI